MFYFLLKQYARLAIKIYCVRVIINKPEIIESKGPLLFASNHPNSFLDGMILTTLLDQPLYSLARGDAFKNNRVNVLLRKLKLLPVYRTSEGIENLGHNYTTFEACRDTFKKKGLVLIFSEGRCENEWHLRPLKKGTARLAVASWKEQIPLTVLPTAFNYSSFEKFGKEVHLFFGEPVQREVILLQENEGKQHQVFNEILNEQLKTIVYEIDKEDKQTIRKTFSMRLKPSFYFLALPAAAGWILHSLLFYACKFFTEFFRNSGHYDSILTAVLLVLYPFYLFALIVVTLPFFSAYALLLLIIMPFTAWACTQAKYQLGI